MIGEGNGSTVSFSAAVSIKHICKGAKISMWRQVLGDGVRSS
jgi:hypothetical protein